MNKLKVNDIGQKRVQVWTCSFKDTSEGKTCSQMILINKY